jgi:hypothetical protein
MPRSTARQRGAKNAKPTLEAPLNTAVEAITGTSAGRVELVPASGPLRAWYNTTWFHVVCIVAMLAVGYVVTIMDWV